jgi:signal transduction histidine kinase
LYKRYVHIISILALLLTSTLLRAGELVTLEQQTGEYALGQTASILEDRDGKFSIEQVASPSLASAWFASTSVAPNFGFSHAVYWLKVNVRNASDVSKWLFELNYVSLDRIELYCPDAKNRGSFIRKVSGDNLKFSEREIRHRTFVFSCDLPYGEQTTLYFRGESQGSHQYGITAWHPIKFAENKSEEQLIFGMFFGIIAVMVIYNLLLYKVLRDSNYINYILYVTGYSIFEISISGLGSQYFWPNWPKFANFIVPLSMFGAGALFVFFTSKFLEYKKHLPLFAKIFMGIIAFNAVMMMLTPFISYAVSIRLVVGVMLLIVTAAFGSALVLFRRGLRYAYFYLIAFGFYLVGCGLMLLRNTGTLPSVFLTDYSMMIGFLFQVVLLSFALSHKIRLEQKAAQKAIEDLNANLEQQVQERTRRISEIISNVKSGFLMIDESQKILDGFTTSCGKIFGKKIATGMHICDLLELSDRSRDHVECAIEQIFQDILPEEALLTNIPKRFKVGSKTVAVEGAVIRNEQKKVQGILFTINDATKISKMERVAEQNQLLLNILNFKDSFRLFVADTHNMLKTIRSHILDKSSEDIPSILHTLKGNCSSFGLNEISVYIHQIEEQKTIDESHINHIETMLTDFLSQHRHVIGVDYRTVSDEIFEVRLSEIDQLRKFIETTGEVISLSEHIRQWLAFVTSKPLISLLGPIHKSVERLAEKYSKNVEIKVIGGDICLRHYAISHVIRQLPHLIRNAVAHGIEDRVNRVGKVEKGLITLKFEENEKNYLQISVSDDGAGIDVRAVANQVIRMGLEDPRKVVDMRDSEIIPYIFHAGLSTSNQVDEVSGRGIGLAAIKEAIDKVGGTITVTTIPGHGTTFVMTIPYAAFIGGNPVIEEKRLLA